MWFLEAPGEGDAALLRITRGAGRECLEWPLTRMDYGHILIMSIEQGRVGMPRPHKCRRILAEPSARSFKPQGIPTRSLARVDLRLDELEAIRLADLEGLYHDAAAERMGVSRATFGRMVQGARRKVAQVLIHSQVLTIQGGNVTIMDQRTFQCADCGHRFQTPFGSGRPNECPACQSRSLHRADDNRGAGRGRCRRRGQGGQAAGRGRRWSCRLGPVESDELEHEAGEQEAGS